MHRLRPTLVTLLALLALPAAPAGASPYSKVLGAYEQYGSIPACRFPSSVLSAALKGVDTYGAQYFADFTAAIQAALAQRGSGLCDHRRQAAPTAATGVYPQSPAGDRALALAPLTATTSSGAPAPVVLMAVLAAAFALIAGLAALGRRRYWEPAGGALWQHAWREAGYRTGGTWAEFVDWLRSA